ncbi:MAG: GGDEF domain-containing protein [Lachnospiraceae bacterium]|nr:GGDEF domain-containing protein [Lachnospiraceae bacterium]
MSVIGFIDSYLALILILVAMTILIHTTVHLSKDMIRNLMILIIYLFVLSVVDYIEVYLGNLQFYSVWRSILTCVKYIVPALMLAQILVTFSGVKNIYAYLPAGINGAICLISVFTGWVFFFSKDTNTFNRGPLGYLPFIVCGGYIIYVAVYTFITVGNQMDDVLPLGFIVLSGLVSVIMPPMIGESFEKWFTTTMAISVFAYYVFLVQQLTKRDSMTSLLNRQSYYADLDKGGDITALISLDMNGLKKLNDTQGHEAGDIALKTLGDCFRKAVNYRQRVYRIGGDEFAIICRHCDEEAVKILIANINDKVGETKYRCSIGFSMLEPGMSLDDLYKKADESMYRAKQEFYKSHTEMDRRKNRR